MSDLEDAELRALEDVINAVSARMLELAANGNPIKASPARVYAAVLHAVLKSARASGHFGAGSLVKASLLDSILDGVEGSARDDAVFASLINQFAHN
ncbi:hypothetical protein OG203_07675 [Nocardia sp. NBC_01499]|uniref:hypothetical protein n=1 Tax=Nocardia sp. NBC_01499 TaxID=2903597 RepID=UPI00386FF623